MSSNEIDQSLSFVVSCPLQFLLVAIQSIKCDSDPVGLNGVTPLTSFLCRLYFNTTSTVCDGGLVAVNGSNGAILWTTWLDDAVFAVNCVADLDLDGIIDCLVIGKSRV